MLMILLACSDPLPTPTGAAPPFDLENTPQPTVFEVGLDAPDADEVHFRWGDTADVAATAYTDGTWKATLFLPAGEQVEVVAVTLVDGVETTTEALSVQVEPATDSLPELTVSLPEEDDGVYILTWPKSTTSLLSIIDHQGRTRWWYEGDEGDYVTQARRSADGRAVVWLSTGVNYGLMRVDLATGDETFLSVPGAHHDFCELPDGSFLVLTEDRRMQDEVTVVGDAVVRVPADGGPQTTIWSSWDNLPFVWDEVPFGEAEVDWTHANSVNYDPISGRALVSLHNLDMVFQLDPETGRTGWMMGGDDGVLDLLEGEPFYGQHGAIATAEGVILFNNRDTLKDASDLWSEAAEYTVDLSTHSYKRVWSYDADKTIFAAVLGNVEPLPDGGRMIGWGSAGRLIELNAAGEVEWQLDTELGGALGYVHRLETILGG